MRINSIIKQTLASVLVSSWCGNRLFATGAGTFAENATKLAQKQKDEADAKWITGKTFRGFITMKIPSTGVFKTLKSVFTGSESKEQPIKLEFRGTILDKLNPFRKPSYWKIYLKDASDREAVISGDLQFKIEGGILKLDLFYDKKPALTCSEPIEDVKMSSLIDIAFKKKGMLFEPQKNTVFADALGLNVSEKTKSMIEQLKLKMDRSGATKMLKDQLEKSFSSAN